MEALGVEDQGASSKLDCQPMRPRVIEDNDAATSLAGRIAADTAADLARSPGSGNVPERP